MNIQTHTEKELEKGLTAFSEHFRSAVVHYYQLKGSLNLKDLIVMLVVVILCIGHLKNTDLLSFALSSKCWHISLDNSRKNHINITTNLEINRKAAKSMVAHQFPKILSFAWKLRFYFWQKISQLFTLQDSLCSFLEKNFAK